MFHDYTDPRRSAAEPTSHRVEEANINRTQRSSEFSLHEGETLGLFSDKNISAPPFSVILMCGKEPSGSAASLGGVSIADGGGTLMKFVKRD